MAAGGDRSHLGDLSAVVVSSSRGCLLCLGDPPAVVGWAPARGACSSRGRVGGLPAVVVPSSRGCLLCLGDPPAVVGRAPARGACSSRGLVGGLPAVVGRDPFPGAFSLTTEERAASVPGTHVTTWSFCGGMECPDTASGSWLPLAHTPFCWRSEQPNSASGSRPPLGHAPFRWFASSGSRLLERAPFLWLVGIVGLLGSSLARRVLATAFHVPRSNVPRSNVPRTLHLVGYRAYLLQLSLGFHACDQVESAELVRTVYLHLHLLRYKSQQDGGALPATLWQVHPCGWGPHSPEQ